MSAKSAQMPSQVVIERLKDARVKKGWTQRQLAEAMTEAGWPIDRTTIAKIEKNMGGRAVNLSLNEVLAFAAVLGMSPLYLMVPWDDEVALQITSKITPSAKQARYWVSGELPIPPAVRNSAMTAVEWRSSQLVRDDYRFFYYMQPPPKTIPGDDHRPDWILKNREDELEQFKGANKKMTAGSRGGRR